MANRILSGFLFVLGGNVGVRVIGIILTPLLVRILGPSKFGDFAFLMSLFGIIVIFVRVGISDGLRKYIAEKRVEKDWEINVFSFYFRVGVGLALFGALSLAIVGYLLPVNQLLGDDFQVYFLLLALVLITEQIVYLLRYTLMGLQLERYSESLAVLKRIIYGIAGLTLAYVGYDIAGLLIGMAIAATLTGLIALQTLRNHLSVKSALTSVPNGFPRRELLGFNFYNTIFILLTASLYHTDIILLQFFISNETTGLYKAALIIAQFIWITPVAIQTVFIHSSSDLWSKNKYDEITDLASRATRYTLSFTLLLVIGIAILNREFILIYYGPDFIASATPLHYLLPGVISFAIARPIYAVGQGRGKLRVLIYATGAAACLNLILNLLFIPRYGMLGAAAATSTGYGSMLLLHIKSARIIGYNPLTDIRLPRIMVTTISSGIFVLALSRMIESAIISLLIIPPLGFVVYLILTIKLQVVDRSELNLIVEILPDTVQKIIWRMD